MSIISSEAGATSSRWGALGMSIFILSHHNTEQCFVHPQPELRAMSPFPVEESSSFSLIFPMEVWKMQEESLQPPNPRRHTGGWVQWGKTYFPSYPAKEPKDICEPDFSISTGKTKLEPFSIVALSLFLPSSLTWPLLGLKNHLCCEKEKLSGMMLTTPAVLLFWEVPLHTKTTQAHNSRLSPLGVPSPTSLAVIKTYLFHCKN